MERVSKQVATEEIESWLDFKKVNEKKRQSFKENIETLIDAIMDGSLYLNEDKVLIQELKFPTDGETPITKLEYKPRLKLGTVHLHLQEVKSGDVDGRLCAYVAALTSKPKAIIKALDTEDTTIGQAIAIFFL